jgi:hypothetical protein
MLPASPLYRKMAIPFNQPFGASHFDGLSAIRTKVCPARLTVATLGIARNLPVISLYPRRLNPTEFFLA